MILQDRPLVVFFLALALASVWALRLFVVHDGIASLVFGQPNQHQAENIFLQQAMDVEFPAPIDYRPIQELCARTEFRPGLLFSCEGQHGGVGMVRNQILRCIRYSIEAGAALVVPSMALRNAKDLTDIETTTEVPLDYLFDREAFMTHLEEGCPGLRLYDTAEDFPSYEQRMEKPLTLIGDQFEPGHPIQGLRHPHEWRGFFDGWLHQQAVQLQSAAPVHVQVGQSFLDWPVRADGDAFMREFGKILSFRKDTRALAAKALFELQKRFALAINPAQAVNPGAFYGAHLRLEEDAIWAWPPEEWRFSRMEDQFEQQFQNLERSGLRVVYVASGNLTVVDMFSDALNERRAATATADASLDKNTQNRGVAVVTKHDLLQGPDRWKLNDMTFDQQGLVDFLIMFKASSFMGVAHSSFPWNVALRRHELSKYTEYGNEGSDLLRDEYSVIMGMAADYPHVDPFVYGIWP